MTIGLISVKKIFPVVNRLQRSKPEKSRNIKDDLNYLSEKKPILLFRLITSLLLIGLSISGSDNCTLHCYKKNLTCSTDFTAFLVKNINCTNLQVLSGPKVTTQVTIPAQIHVKVTKKLLIQKRVIK